MTSSSVDIQTNVIKNIFYLVLINKYSNEILQILNNQTEAASSLKYRFKNLHECNEVKSFSLNHEFTLNLNSLKEKQTDSAWISWTMIKQ